MVAQNPASWAAKYLQAGFLQSPQGVKLPAGAAAFIQSREFDGKGLIIMARMVKQIVLTTKNALDEPLLPDMRVIRL